MHPLAESRVDAERHNAAQPINRLPIELLSRIFVAGDELDQDKVQVADEDNAEADLEFQELVVQVCRHWRTVALDMPTLWSYITISGPAPHLRAQSFLARSGPTTPLELELDMTNDFMDGLEEYDSYSHADRATQTLQSIVDRGGATSRWKSLKVWSELPSVMLAVIDFIVGSALDQLVTLELVAECDDPAWIGDLSAEALVRRDLSESAMFHKPPPQLRNLELLGIPCDFFFADPSRPLVSNLTHLELGTTTTLPPLDGLYQLLLRNPGLESLALDMSMVDQIELGITPLKDVARLPHLRRFALIEPRSSFWAISVLAMIDALGVVEFKLDLNHTLESLSAEMVAFYASSGRRNFGMVYAFSQDLGDSEDSGPIYPALQHLAIGPFPNRSAALGKMVRAFSTITRLDWELEGSCEEAILDLAKAPLPCPRLEHLRVYGVPDAELLKVVCSLIEHGAPLKTVEVNSRDWDLIQASTKQHLGGILKNFGQYVDDNESDSESDDWTDTDDDGEDDGSTSDSTRSETSD
ncbi:hypothetical protein FS749_006025 [Ceratobasidium sp. UAMH 11750]|nr:hypothetical protein FS749_006025 [Ceratobasidium sp. UAMH 11750]